MTPLSTRRCCVLLASVLAAACRRPDPPAPRRPPDAPARLDAGVDAGVNPAVARMTLPDAAAPDRPAEDVPPRSPLDLFALGGVALLRPGSTVALRVERSRVGDPRVTDVTRAATFRVEPATTGRVDPAGVFHGLAVGRAEVIAAERGDEARTIVEVSSELPAGVTAIPTARVSDGRVVHSVRFGALPDGTVMLEVQATSHPLMLRGRRLGNTFPMTIPVEDRAPAATGDLRDAGAGAPPVTGTLVLDRWVDRRLDGHAALQVAGRPLEVRFTVLVGDVSPLLQRVGP
ncbi:MAG: hypothetical protein Q8S73_04050 [Deltaproteobacteria bacterium]|nr:hypothetical protein [Deltaproteobacteria bacterium]